MPNSADHRPAPSLWRHADFLKLWAGESISLVGTQITTLALPLTAIQLLHASPIQMAVLTAAGSVPRLVFSLPSGVLADRVHRRPLLIGANLGRAAVLAGIPAAGLLGLLTLPLLAAVAFVTASLGVVFGTAYTGLLPSLVESQQLVEGNSKLEVSRNVASTVGPGLAGILVQVLTAPVTIALDSVSYLSSVLTLVLIRTQEPPIERRPSSTRQDLLEGFSVVLDRPVIWSMFLAVGIANLFLGGLVAEQILFMTRALHLAPASIGWMLAAAGPSGIFGAVLAGAVGRKIGVGRAMIGGGLGYGFGALLFALAQGTTLKVTAVVVGAEIVMGLAAPIYSVTFASLIQSDVPNALLGRTSAISTLVLSGTVPIGSLAGGALAQSIGVRPVLVIVGCGVITTFGALILSPVYRYRRPD